MGERVTPVICPDELLHDLDKFFRNQHLAECAAAESRQKRIAKFAETGRRSIDGLGRPVMEMDEYVLAHWRQRLGYNPLKDSGWRKYIQKHCPEARLHATGVKDIHVGWQRGMDLSPSRYHKKYG